MGSVNDGLRFLLEIGVLAALGVWGFTAHAGASRWLFGLGAPLLVAVAWTLVVTPNGSLAVGDPWRLLLELVIFGAGIAALAAIGRGRLALTFAILVFVHLVSTFVLDQR
jgi:hypothetical protein